MSRKYITIAACSIAFLAILALNLILFSSIEMAHYRISIGHSVFENIGAAVLSVCMALGIDLAAFIALTKVIKGK